MNLHPNKTNYFILGILFATIISCNTSKNENNKNKIFKAQTETDTIYHGYNELANPQKLDNFTISDYNTDNSEIKNIERPRKSTIKTKLDTTNLFKIWTSDPNGPHADFVFSNKSFYVVDYDGDGDMPYELINNNLKIYYNDFIQEGKIISVKKDTLRIKWNNFEEINNYVPWKN